LLVRHAEKEATGSDPALTPAGVERATLLARMVRDAKVSAVFATDKLRTQQTAAPAAEILKLKPVIVPSNDVPGLGKRILAHTGEAVLVVGHSNTVPEIIEALGGRNDLTIDESEYDKLFVLTFRPGKSPVVVVLRYGAGAKLAPSGGGF
jgi:broad specificity phosphatase PhoE